MITISLKYKEIMIGKDEIHCGVPERGKQLGGLRCKTRLFNSTLRKSELEQTGPIYIPSIPEIQRKKYTNNRSLLISKLLTTAKARNLNGKKS